MKVLLLSLIVLGLVAYITRWIRSKTTEQTNNNSVEDKKTYTEVDDSGCCGQHEMCEKDSLLAAVSKKIEYFDDHELDRHIGKAEDEYTEEEVEEFRQILYTTNEDEIAAWIRSLQLRGIEVPKDMKDELILIMTERRERLTH